MYKMKSDLDYDDEQIPTYEESVSATGFSSPASRLNSDTASDDTKVTPRQLLQTQISSTRSYRVQSIISAYIEPLLVSQGLDGIAKSTFVLIPSDTLSSLPNLKAKDLVGLPEAARNVTIIRLHGPDNQASFWEQPVVVRQLSSDLKARTAASGHKIQEEQQPPQVESCASIQRPDQSRAGGRSSWLSRSLKAGQSDPTASMSHWKLGWRPEAANEENSTSLGPDEVRVNARIRDVSVMTESELGLLLTETVKGVWLEVEVGT